MAERIQKPKTRTSRKTSDTTDESTVQNNAAKLKADMDDILDEIDAVLEENAEEFVAGYRQYGGE